MVQAACDRVWESRQILLTARPQPQSEDDDEKEEGDLLNEFQHVQLNEFQHCHEVLFGGDEDRRKYLIRKILTYLI